jgi:hypothetical protein
MKIRSVGSELFHAGGRTDMTKLIVAFRICAKATKITWIKKRFDVTHSVNYNNNLQQPTNKMRTICYLYIPKVIRMMRLLHVSNLIWVHHQGVHT